MDITISFFMLAAIVIISLMGGFWIGRSVRWMMLDTESRISEENEPETDRETNIWTDTKTNTKTNTEPGITHKKERQNGKLQKGAKRIPLGWTIGSPVSGTVRSFSDSAGKGALICPEQGNLYAPASGKITRLYPMGNAMLLRTDFGVELLLRVGESRDELFSMYYRSYVVQNEIVSKGKLLLEFDLEGLHAEGVDASVSVTVNAADDSREITLTQKEKIKTGEELLWVREPNVLEIQQD